MAILAAGTNNTDLQVTGGTATVTTGANKYANVQEAIDLADPAVFAWFDIASQNDLWVSFYAYSASVGTRSQVSFFDTGFSTTQPIFALEISSTSPRPMAIKAWNGTTLAALATATGAWTLSSLQRIDIHIKRDDAGEAQIYVNGVLQWSFTGDTNLFASSGINRVQWTQLGSGGANSYYSAFIVADEDTRSMFLCQSKPSAAGASQQWAGVAANLNETGTNDDTQITESTVGEISTFTKAALPAALNTLVPQAVIISARGQVSDDTLYDIAPMMRIGGVNYQVATDLNHSPGIKNRQAIVALNPATSAAWTFSAIDGAEVGVKLVNA